MFLMSEEPLYSRQYRGLNYMLFGWFRNQIIHPNYSSANCSSSQIKEGNTHPGKKSGGGYRRRLLSGSDVEQMWHMSGSKGQIQGQILALAFRQKSSNPDWLPFRSQAAPHSQQRSLSYRMFTPITIELNRKRCAIRGSHQRCTGVPRS